MSKIRRHLLQQPTSLQSFAIANIGNWVASQAEELTRPVSSLRQRSPTEAEEFLSARIELIRNHLEHIVLGTFYNTVATEVMRALIDLLTKINRTLGHNREWYCAEGIVELKHVIGRMIETIFTGNLTKISFEYNSLNNIRHVFGIWAVFQSSFCSKSSLLTGLTHLELKGGAQEAEIIQFVKELRNLKYLRLAYSCTDNVLRCIADNCERVETLDLSGNGAVNNDSVDILAQFPNLRNVDLYRTQVTHKGFVKLLMSCDNIEYINFPPSDFLSIVRALEYIASSEEYVGKKFKLKYFSNVRDNGTIIEQLQLVLQMCPLIQRICLQKLYFDPSENYVKLLNDLQELKQLDLFNNDFFEDHVDELLRVRGRDLEHLSLNEMEIIDLNALKYIYLNCPNLQSLTIKTGEPFQKEPTRDLLSNENEIEIKIPPLRYLKKLTLFSEFSLNLPEDEFIFLLSNCPNVEFIDIQNSTQYEYTVESVFLKVLENDPQALMYLKELRTGVRLSTVVIDKLTQNCVNLQEIKAYY